MRNALILGMLISTGAIANECQVVITSNDQMQYSTKMINLPKSCTELAITLKHVGKLPRLAMGHNLVVVKKSDLDAVAADAVSAGSHNGYLKPNDERVLAHTALLGGGEESTVLLDAKKLIHQQTMCSSAHSLAIDQSCRAL